MIEILNGMTETINYRNSMDFRLFHNVDYEDYPTHWHVGIEILMPVTEIYGVIVDQKKYVLQEGDILIVNSGVPHALEAPPTGERIILQFDPALLYSLKEMETLLLLFPPVFYITPENEPDLYPLVKAKMEEIIREYDGQQAFAGALVYASLIELFAGVGRITRERNIEGTALHDMRRSKQDRQWEYQEVALKACNYINQHYQEKLTLEETAKMVGFSKYHFTRVFKKYMNMTFYEYLNKKRVKCAEGLLYSTEMSITDVAMNSGFSSMSSFDRTFKALNKCSPSEFRGAILDRIREKGTSSYM
ncbi:transcriptional regulator, AraC family [Marvinbryantia formatexigens DSM 14469]|uniref:Transcriptional regulator, AraC family n=1 Tax=Marvinbryantia formatexigens DSM 14469 TaxID=478749 RepID=C6LL88_9FIRM|nr:AraC family transcriptional regulator [Marvinbryantia formatexigens]EET58599.1 transcriptional regulator, AraC family [Marvinbryantia formatexigens DSM 14469]UWO25511.1 AraC family transcriptional regulator [Marvinbryantia formatexigens DSM 14469]SDG92590.1 AraC-type DNA-binding protein [Marvinbryantia formatexigens]